MKHLCNKKKKKKTMPLINSLEGNRSVPQGEGLSENAQ